ncbi:hypothetical protein GQR58_004158 [Nymphon striatum]|nr:hypothetical protein GQR58_004158 [Nymphon striatum]
MVAELRTASNKVGLEINLSKTKVMFNRNVEIQPIMTGNVALDQVDRYTYLGQLISIHRDWEPEVRRRVALKVAMATTQTFVTDSTNDIQSLGVASAAVEIPTSHLTQQITSSPEQHTADVVASLTNSSQVSGYSKSNCVVEINDVEKLLTKASRVAAVALKHGIERSDNNNNILLSKASHATGIIIAERYVLENILKIMKINVLKALKGIPQSESPQPLNEGTIVTEETAQSTTSTDSSVTGTVVQSSIVQTTAGTPQFITVAVADNSDRSDQDQVVQEAVALQTGQAGALHPAYVQYVDQGTSSITDPASNIYAAANGQMTYSVYSVSEGGSMYTPASGSYYNATGATAVTHSQVC